MARFSRRFHQICTVTDDAAAGRCHDDDMDKILDFATSVLYAIAAISGCLGAGAVAGYDVLRGKPMRLSYIAAYAIIGLVLGLINMAYGTAMGLHANDLDSVIGSSIILGAAGTIALASMNISSKWIFRRLGVEVELNVKRIDK